MVKVQEFKEWIKEAFFPAELLSFSAWEKVAVAAVEVGLLSG